MISMMMLRKRLRSDAGATLVEYALLVALILVVSIGAISALEDRADERAGSTAGRIGAPGDAAYYGGGTTGGSTGGSTTGPPPPPPSTVTVSSITSTPPPTNDGSKWVASATITVVDGATPLVGVIVTGSWTIEGPGGGSPTTATCPTGITGACAVQFNSIQDSKEQVRFTVTKLTKDGVDTVPPDPKPYVIVDCNSVPGIC